MLIGSNNSLTYFKPYSLWNKVFSLFNKCQSVTCKEQYDYCGVKLFDFKLYTDKYNHIIAKNRNVKYTIFSLYEILCYLNTKNDVVIKITFESTKKNNKAENKFIYICGIIETIYPNIKYFGGTRKYDGKIIYNFKYEKENGAPKIIDIANSTWVYRKFPILSSFFNKYNIKKYEKENAYLLLNFVDRR